MLKFIFYFLLLFSHVLQFETENGTRMESLAKGATAMADAAACAPSKSIGLKNSAVGGSKNCHRSEESKCALHMCARS